MIYGNILLYIIGDWYYLLVLFIVGCVLWLIMKYCCKSSPQNLLKIGWAYIIVVLLTSKVYDIIKNWLVWGDGGVGALMVFTAKGTMIIQ